MEASLQSAPITVKNGVKKAIFSRVKIPLYMHERYIKKMEDKKEWFNKLEDEDRENMKVRSKKFRKRYSDYQDRKADDSAREDDEKRD